MDRYACWSNGSTTFCESVLPHFKNVTGRQANRQDLKPVTCYRIRNSPCCSHLFLRLVFTLTCNMLRLQANKLSVQLPTQLCDNKKFFSLFLHAPIRHKSLAWHLITWQVIWCVGGGAYNSTQFYLGNWLRWLFHSRPKGALAEFKTKNVHCTKTEKWGSCRGDCEDYCLLECGAV